VLLFTMLTGNGADAYCARIFLMKARHRRCTGWGEGREMSLKERGFASMDGKKCREIASKGRKAAHPLGIAHRWTREEARLAGKKGGEASGRRRNTAAAERVGN
jgi:general stress protein YciG